MNEQNLWTNPLEVFEWKGKFIIREVASKHKVVCLWDANIDGREYWQIKRMREQIAPLVCRMMNETEVSPVSASIEVTSNGDEVEKKRRGNPAWFKGMKAPEGSGRPKGS